MPWLGIEAATILGRVTVFLCCISTSCTWLRLFLMRFCGLPDTGTDGDENCVLGTNWDIDCMARTDGDNTCIAGTDSWDSGSIDARVAIDDLVFRSGLSAPTLPSWSQIVSTERDIAKQKKKLQRIICKFLNNWYRWNAKNKKRKIITDHCFIIIIFMKQKKMDQVGHTPNRMHFFLKTDSGTSNLHCQQTYIQCRFKVLPNWLI